MEFLRTRVQFPPPPPIPKPQPYPAGVFSCSSRKRGTPSVVGSTAGAPQQPAAISHSTGPPPADVLHAWPGASAGRLACAFFLGPGGRQRPERQGLAHARRPAGAVGMVEFGRRGTATPAARHPHRGDAIDLDRRVPAHRCRPSPRSGAGHGRSRGRRMAPRGPAIRAEGRPADAWTHRLRPCAGGWRSERSCRVRKAVRKEGGSSPNCDTVAVPRDSRQGFERTPRWYRQSLSARPGR